MIQSYTKYKRFKSLVDAKENGKAVRSGLGFLSFVAEEYRRLFRQFLVDKRPYFEKLKELVAKEDWDDFVVKFPRNSSWILWRKLNTIMAIVLL